MDVENMSKVNVYSDRARGEEEEEEFVVSHELSHLAVFWSFRRVLVEVTNLRLRLVGFWKFVLDNETNCLVSIHCMRVCPRKVWIINNFIPEQVDEEYQGQSICPSCVSKLSIPLDIFLHKHR